MPSPKAVLKSVGPKLVPFFKTVAVYFVLFLPSTSGSWFACIIKCLPIISLCFFVLLHGMNLSDEYAYSRRILCGLVFSMVGDACLIWSHLFIYGLISFGIAQFIYASAFGLKPIKPILGAVCFTVMSLLYTLISPYLKGIMVYCVPLYGLLIFFMAWRAIARVQFFEDLWTWTKLCSCVGALLFCISDAILAFNKFAFIIPHSQALIMTTYYGAQVGIALSVVDSMEGSSMIKNPVKEAKTSCIKSLALNNEHLRNQTAVQRKQN